LDLIHHCVRRILDSKYGAIGIRASHEEGKARKEEQGSTKKLKCKKNQNSVSFDAGNLIDLKEILWEFMKTVFASYSSWS